MRRRPLIAIAAVLLLAVAAAAYYVNAARTITLSFPVYLEGDGNWTPLTGPERNRCAGVDRFAEFVETAPVTITNERMNVLGQGSLGYGFVSKFIGETDEHCAFWATVKTRPSPEYRIEVAGKPGLHTTQASIDEHPSLFNVFYPNAYER